MNNNIVTASLFTDDLFDELLEGGPRLDALVRALSEEIECDYSEVTTWLRSQQARDATIAIREKNTAVTYSRRLGATYYINNPTEEVPSGASRVVLAGPRATGAMAAASRAVPFIYADDPSTGFTLSTNKETITLAQAGLYHFQFSGKIAPYAYIPGTEVNNNLLSQAGAVFTPLSNANTSAPVDIVLAITYTPEGSSTAKTIYQTIGSVAFLLSDYTNNRVRAVEGTLKLRLTAGATVSVIFQRRREQGTVTVGSANYREALGFIKEPFTIPGSVNPLIDGSNYLRVLRLA